MNEGTPVRPRWRVLARALMATGAALIALLLGADTAAADNTVSESTPADGSTVATSPEAITIVFVEELGDTNTIGLTCDAELQTLEATEVDSDGRTLTAAIAEPLPSGTCVANWLVSDPDGEPNGQGNITFNVQSGTTPTTVATIDDTAANTTVPTTGDTGADAGTDGDVTAGTDSVTVVDLDEVEGGQGPLWLGRLVSMIGLSALFGGLIVIAAAWPEGVEYLLTVRFMRLTWIMAALGSLLYVVAASAAVTGSSFGSGINPASWTDLLDAGTPGIAALVQLALTIVIGWVAFRPDRAIDPTTQLAGLGLPALAVATLGLARIGGDFAALGVVLNVLQALALAIWVGGAILVARVVLAGPGEEDLVHAVRGFGRISNLAIVVTIVTAIAEMIRVDGGNLFSSSHGRVVVLRMVILAAMVFVAMSARQFVNQRLARAHEMTLPMAERLRRAFGIEALLGIVVFALTAWALALSPPSFATAPSIDYAIERRVQVDDADFDVTVKLTSDRVGVQGLEVEVNDPESGLSNLEVVFTAPPNDTIGTITQPVPLDGRGVAVRQQSDGLPMTVAGEWSLTVNAQTSLGVVTSDPQTFVLLNEDGTTPTTALTIPPSIVVTIPEATTTVPG
ncbi:MAG: copper resistance protein CopC [Actinomycetota bacterium]